MSIKRNLVANFIANAWMAVVSVLFVPLYIHFIGIEAYGLVGIFSTLQAMASVLDFGFTVTMNREMARYSAQPETAGEVRDLVRTLEVIYWSIAILIGIVVCVFAPVISATWINTVNLSRETVRTALILIGIIMTLQWPFSFYAGGLMGLQKQVLLATVTAVVATFRGIGLILVLAFISPTIEAFFIWQLLVAAISTLLVLTLLWRNLPRSSTYPRFRIEQLKRVGRFSAGVGAIGVISVILTQMDKVVLSKLVTLESLGYYTLAGVIAASLYMFMNPIYNAVFPRMTQLVSGNNQTGVANLYHRSTEAMTVLVMSAAIVLAVFPRQVILAWTGNAITATNAQDVVALLAIGTGIYGVMHIPWAVQLAYGWARLSFVVSLATVIVMLPVMVILVIRFGMIGGAITWVTLNIIEMLGIQYVMHRRILKGELRRWYVLDVGRPILVSLVVALLARLLIYDTMPRGVLIVTLVLISACVLLASAVSISSIRLWILNRFIKSRKLLLHH